jgi:uncharacterized protein (TIGR03083 family)
MDTIRDMIAAQRGELATVLAELPASGWDEPTLCAGWRVREVVAHITMPFRYGGRRFVLELAKSRGRFNEMADRVARRDADRMSLAELIDAVRANVDHPWRPPGGGFEGALAHDLIHGLDITVALGMDQPVPADRLRRVLPASTTEKSVAYFGTDLAGIELRACDLDWTLGSGAPLTGAAADLLLAVCGRKLPAGRLAGEPAARFTRRESLPPALDLPGSRLTARGGQEEHGAHKRRNPASPVTDESCAAGGDLWRDGRASYPPLVGSCGFGKAR